MIRRLPLAALATFATLAACRDEARPGPGKVVEPPVSSPDGIPDAPVSGRIRGAPFLVRDARYVVDRRAGYAHTDIALSAGKAEEACGPVSPRTSSTLWLRLEGEGRLEATSGRVGPGSSGQWDLHYQVYDGEAWTGTGGGSALLVLHPPGPDGRLSGGIAVCFPDDAQSCASGSFEAVACPPTIDQPVRGSPPSEAVPQPYLQRLGDGGRR
jgi:hypothetical protein